MPKRSPSKNAPRRAKRTSAPKRKNGGPAVQSVAVVVSDRNRAVEWYTETLGLDHVHDQDHFQTVGRKGKGGLLHLCQVTEYDPKGALEPGVTGILLTLPGDFVAACRALEARGVKFSTPATKFDWGWGASIVDPDGNELYLGPA